MIKATLKDMNVLFFWGYAVLIIGILIAFSITNRRTGWKRNRIAPADVLKNALRQRWKESQLARSARVTVPPTRDTEFTSQLLNLGSALNNYRSMPVQSQSPALEVENVPAGR